MPDGVPIKGEQWMCTEGPIRLSATNGNYAQGDLGRIVEPDRDGYVWWACETNFLTYRLPYGVFVAAFGHVPPKPSVFRPPEFYFPLPKRAVFPYDGT